MALKEDYLRSIMFGAEDSLVSTTGVVAGIAVGSQQIRFVLLAALVTIVVEALSMGAGEFLTERTVHQLNRRHSDNPGIGALLMFSAYAAVGFIPVVPILMLPYPISVITSVGVALFSLFALGFVKGRVVHVSSVRSGVEVLVVGGIATLIGIAVGILLKT